MTLRGPRTLLGLILSGLALVSFPLLIAIGNAAFRLGQLTSDSERVLTDGAQTTLLNRSLESLLIDLERNARRYVVLDDAEVLALYLEDEGQMTQTLEDLSGLPQSADIRELLQFISTEVGNVDEILRGKPDDTASDRIVEAFRAMDEAAATVDDRMQQAINRQLETLQGDTARAQEVLAWQAAALLPLTLVLVVFFLLLIARPMRKIDRAISELGDGDYAREIAISGPADIETLGRQLEWLRHRLQESANEKNKFLRHMSHELKTPLANIREGAELLIDGSVGPLARDQSEVAEILRMNSIKLQRLIENLLTYSAWQANAASLENTTFELKPLVFSVVSQHRLTISNRHIKLRLDVTDTTVFADATKLRLILDNLLSNAVKFTPEQGSISVSAAATESELTIVVNDSGPGIDDADRDRIFEAFYQGQRMQGGPVGGTGIGLSIVLECVQAYGGTVELIEGNLSGACFCVSLPLDQSRNRQALVANG